MSTARSHLEYYRYQVEARGVRNAADVRRLAHEQAFLFAAVRAWLPMNPRAAMADIGCGHGSFLCWLRELGYEQCLGVDSSEEQVRVAQCAGLAVELGDGIEWLERRPAGSLETVFGIDLIEHLPKDQVMGLLAGAQRALASGGCLIMRLPNGDSPLVGLNLFNDITHVWTYTSNCLETLAKMHGFERCEFRDPGFASIRDQRWLKVPLAWAARAMLRVLLQAASKDRIQYWSSSLWACLIKAEPSK